MLWRVFLAEITSVISFLRYKKFRAIGVINIQKGITLKSEIILHMILDQLFHTLNVFILNV